ncbi:hypothetical protein MB02_15300 [Croceicoccus estronivorus]|nr:hypothetical protein MB02_15300 [Croceicoccus estronivorus]
MAGERHHPYEGWYDDYYGPIYDGYWSEDGSFYFRVDGRDAHYRRDEQQHFRRGDQPEDPRFHRLQAAKRAVPHDARMPNSPGDDRK